MRKTARCNATIVLPVTVESLTGYRPEEEEIVRKSIILKHKILEDFKEQFRVGDAQTRDWIEYKHSNKALMIGAFSLERIR